MYWLVLIFFYVSNFQTPEGTAATSVNNMLHVGTFRSMADCQTAAKSATNLGMQSTAGQISFECVNSGSLLP
jgi:hypothetical protein